jgi:glycosyltransferase involved in cell wall biosynthesis
MKPGIRVTHYNRRPYGNYFSIERVFAAVRTEFPEDIECRTFVCRFISRGVFRRLWNVIEAAFHQGQINHITGDVHFIAALLRKRQTILTIHDCGLLRKKRGAGRWLFKLLWYQIPMWRSAVVVAISEFTRLELQEILPAFAGKVVVIPDPLVGGFAESPRSFNQAEPRILHIGTAPNKNIERVGEALEGIRCSMEIIGKMNPSQIAALDRFGIKYSSSRNLTDAEIIEKYRSADIVEFCSTYEGFGMPVIEANATGRVVVTSRMEPMISVANGAACLVDPYDPKSIRAGILRVIEDCKYREELVAAGLENAKRFSAKAVALAYAGCYRDLKAAMEHGNRPSPRLL